MRTNLRDFDLNIPAVIIPSLHSNTIDLNQIPENVNKWSEEIDGPLQQSEPIDVMDGNDFNNDEYGGFNNDEYGGVGVVQNFDALGIVIIFI